MLRVRLLGELEAELGTGLVPPPTSRRAWELLAWLAMHPGDHPRGALAARFWPDVLDASARASLRSAVWALRRALGPEGEDTLVATRERVGLACETDLAAFDRHLAAGELEAAVALCRGPLLAGLDADWVLEARDRENDRLAEALGILADTAGTPAEAVGFARRRLAVDPLDEAAARDLMTRLAAAGDRAGAFSVYDRLGERLRTQLGIAPSAATRETAGRLRGDAPAETAAPHDGGGPPLVGRDAELRALIAALAAGQGGMAVLSGEGGIGKTRLAREALDRARADGARTAECGALELGGPAPFTLWAELLRTLAVTLPPPEPDATWPEELAAVGPSLPRRLGRPATRAPAAIAPELARARLFEAAVEAIEHACRDRALVLLFEDVHLADGASLELLAYTARRFAGLPVLAILTRRHTPDRPEIDALLSTHRARGGGLVELDLAPLSRAAIEALVKTAGPLDADTRAQLVAAADGNPLLAVESARAAAAGHSGSPRSLQALVRAALGRLDPGPRHAAELAAVAGRDLSRAELEPLATVEDVLGALDSGLFAPEDQRFGFRHALLREAAAAPLPAPRRRELHAELAGALRGSAAETARHLRLAGRDDEAAERLASAAADAIAVGAVGEAIGFLAEALELRPHDAALWLDSAHAHAWNGDHEAAERALAAALAAIPAEDHAARAAAHVRGARWYSGALCRPRRTVAQARAALAELEALPAPDPALLGIALAMGAWGASVAGRAEDADALLARLDALTPHTGELEYEATNARAFRALRADDLEAALRWFYALVRLVHGAPDRAFVAWVNLSCIASALGRPEEGLTAAESADVRGLPALVAPLHAIRASLLARTGRLPEARAALAAEREAAERSGNPELIALADHDAGQVAVVAGEWEDASDLLGRALDAGAAVSRPVARLARAEALARAHRPDEAEAELRQVTLEPVGPVDRPHVLVARLTHVQGLVALERGDDALAARRFREAAAAWRRPHASSDARDLLANLVDLGRPTVGTIEPALELARVEGELARLESLPT